MALWICNACKTAYAVDAPACPHCGGTEHGTDHDTVLVGEPGPEPEVAGGALVAPKK